MEVSSKKHEQYFSNSSDLMLKYIPNGVKRTLEFGCARGFFSEMIAKRDGAQCWGVEIHKDSAEDAKSRMHRVLCMDAQLALKELPKNSFDCIIFNDVLEHLVDPYALLEQIKEYLGEGGVVVASIPNIRFWRVFKELAMKAQWEYTSHGILDRTHLRFFTHKSIRNMFERAGYEVSVLEGIRPTTSKSFKIVNCMLLGSIWDMQYHQFAVAARAKK